jgi:hypothetical protein
VLGLLSNISSGQVSPRIGILGQHSYRPEERGITDESTNSVASQIRRIEDYLVDGFDAVTAYKNEAKTLRADIDTLMGSLIA